MKYSERVNKAAELVKIAHEGQFRKDGKTPYITHPYAVADIVNRIFGERTDIDIMLISALAHDCVEDVDDFDLDEFVEEVFDHRMFHTPEQESVKGIVLAMTKNDTIPGRHAKDRDSYERLSKIGYNAISIKLCDRIHNVMDMTGMSDEHKRRYIAETYYMLGYFQSFKGNPAYKQLFECVEVRGKELFK